MINKIKEIIAEELGIEAATINDDTNIVDDLEADSLSVMQIAQEIETEFNVEINEDQLMSVKTPADIAKILEENK